MYEIVKSNYLNHSAVDHPTSKQNSFESWRLKLTELIGSKKRLLLFLFTILLITLVLYWRRPDAFVNPQLWAEDGEVFFTDTFFKGINALFVSYREIYHVLGRLVALPSKWLPLVYIPHYYYFMSWLMLVALTGFIFSNRFTFPLPIKFFMSLALVANAADNEVHFNIANWATISSLWFILLAIAITPATRSGKIFDFTLLVLNGLNAAFAAVLWPLFLFRWVLSRNRYHAFLSVTAFLSAIAQLLHANGRIPPGTLLPRFGPRMADVLISRFGFMFVGEHIYRLHFTDLFRISGIILLLFILCGLLWHGIKNANWEMVIILSGGLLCAVLSIYVNRRSTPELLIIWSGRHYYIPAVTMIWTLLLWKPKHKALQWISLLMIALTFLFFTPKHKNEVFPDLNWEGEIAACRGTQPRCLIPINPVWDPLRWFATIDSHITSEPEFSVPFQANFDNQIKLRGYSIEQTDDALFIELVWFVSDTPNGAYTQFIHLANASVKEQILAQSDTLPQQGHYSTDAWIAGEYIVELSTLSLSSLPSGEYSLFVGWYDANSATLERLPAFNPDGSRWEDDRVELLSPVVIEP